MFSAQGVLRRCKLNRPIFLYDWLDRKRKPSILKRRSILKHERGKYLISYIIDEKYHVTTYNTITVYLHDTSPRPLGRDVGSTSRALSASDCETKEQAFRFINETSRRLHRKSHEKLPASHVRTCYREIAEDYWFSKNRFVSFEPTLCQNITARTRFKRRPFITLKSRRDNLRSEKKNTLTVKA